MPDGEVEYYCFLTKETFEQAREPYYSQGAVSDNLNESLLLLFELSDANPRRRQEDKVFLSYATNKTAIQLGYRGDQIEVPPDVDSEEVEDEIVEMLDQIVQIEPAEIYGEERLSQVVGAAKRKHQDELQDIVIVTPEEHTHEVKGELMKKQLSDEIEVMTPSEMLGKFVEDDECRVQ